MSLFYKVLNMLTQQSRTSKFSLMAVPLPHRERIYRRRRARSLLTRNQNDLRFRSRGEGRFQWNTVLDVSFSGSLQQRYSIPIFSSHLEGSYHDQ